MVAIGGYFSTGFILWKNIQQCRIGHLFRDTASRVTRSVEVIKHSHGTYDSSHCLHGSRSSRPLFRNGAMNNSMSCKVTECYSSILFNKNNQSNKYLHSQAHLMPVNPNDDRKSSHEQRRNIAMDIEELVEFLQDENANDICVIRVPPHLDCVNYFVICSGFGARHLRRMADGLVAEVRH